MFGWFAKSKEALVLKSPPHTIPPDPKTHVNSWTSSQILYFLKFIPLIEHNANGEAVKRETVFSRYFPLFKNFSSGEHAVRYVKNNCNNEVKVAGHLYQIQDFFTELVEVHDGFFDPDKFTVFHRLISIEDKFKKGLVSNYIATLKKSSINSAQSTLDVVRDIASKLLSSTEFFDLVNMYGNEAQPMLQLAHERNFQQDLLDNQDDVAAMNFFSELQSQSALIRVKLIFSPTFDAKKPIQKILGTLQHSVSGGVLRHYLQTPYASFHASILVDGYLVDYNDSGIVMPRKFNRKNALFILDACRPIEDTLENRQKIKDAIFEVSKTYSTRKTYCNIPKADVNLGNCQTYALELIKTITENLDLKEEDLLIKKSGCIYNYLSYMRDEPQPKLMFKPGDAFINSASGNGFFVPSKIEFDTHEHLDEFVIKCRNNLHTGDKTFEERFPQEYFLLKAFDRYFWTKLLFTEIRDFEKENGDTLHAQDECKKFKEKCKPYGFAIEQGYSLLADLKSPVFHAGKKHFVGHSSECPFCDPRHHTFAKHM